MPTRDEVVEKLKQQIDALNSEVDELVEELKNISPTFPVLFQSALYENLKKRGDIK